MKKCQDDLEKVPRKTWRLTLREQNKVLLNREEPDKGRTTTFTAQRPQLAIDFSLKMQNIKGLYTVLTQWLFHWIHELEINFLSNTFLNTLCLEQTKKKAKFVKDSFYFLLLCVLVKIGALLWKSVLALCFLLKNNTHIY